MLKIKSNCERCHRLLPNESKEAMICSFECTFCRSCVDNILFNTCPNCGGNFEKRPIRPAQKLIQCPAEAIASAQPTDTNLL